MTLREEILGMEEQLTAMLMHLRDLRLRVDDLEAQNARLRERISADQVISEGEAALRGLYNDDFHICPAHFGEGRNGEDCLFCLSFLEEAGKPSDYAKGRK